MEPNIVNLTIPIMQVYQLTYDGVDTGLTLDELRKMLEENGPDHKIQITATIPITNSTTQSVEQPITALDTSATIDQNSILEGIVNGTMAGAGILQY